MRSYLLPKSMTWWAGLGLILTGLLRGVDAGFDLGGMADVIDAWSGSTSPSVLIMEGAGLIGLRGALSRATTGA